MVDHATPNLPSRSLDATVAFYSALGFTVMFRDAGWLILSRERLVLEFFPYPNLDPATSSFGACLRLDDLDTFYSECQRAGIPETTVGWPRIEPPRQEASGLRIGALLDPDGSLLRLIHNRAFPSDVQL
ncbi:MAG: bleomycin resistance protein [Propionibacteriaceae bacterium]|nr:bleomycin resistance protein [Propionibacteriaceae bacterium]